MGLLVLGDCQGKAMTGILRWEKWNTRGSYKAFWGMKGFLFLYIQLCKLGGDGHCFYPLYERL
jgi:hypothetical protein